MPISFTGEPAPPELAPGQHVYEALVNVARDLDTVALMGVLESIQRGGPFARLPSATRQIFSTFESRILADDDNTDDGGEG